MPDGVSVPFGISATFGVPDCISASVMVALESVTLSPGIKPPATLAKRTSILVWPCGTTGDARAMPDISTSCAPMPTCAIRPTASSSVWKALLSEPSLGASRNSTASRVMAVPLATFRTATTIGCVAMAARTHCSVANTVRPAHNAARNRCRRALLRLASNDAAVEPCRSRCRRVVRAVRPSEAVDVRKLECGRRSIKE